MPADSYDAGGESFLMRSLDVIVVLGLCGCLPPPRAWLEASPSGPPPPGADDTAISADEGVPDDPAANDTGGPPEDTGVPPLLCHSLAFEDNGHVQITADQLGVDTLFDENSVTIESWVWFSAETDTESWLLAGMDGTQAWRLGVELGELVLRAGIYNLAIPLPDHGWHHISGVINGEEGLLSLYVDGEFSGSRLWSPPMSSPSGSPAIHLGSWDTAGGAWPNVMDDVRFTTAVMHTGSVRFETDAHRPVSDWIGVWRFDENLENAVNGVAVSGENIQYTNSCP
jgi:hypothetical protein